MEDYEVSEVARILSEWNPLGDEAAKVPDLDSYKTESIDILFHINKEYRESKFRENNDAGAK